MQQLLSVIVLNYNGSSHNVRCLRSLLAQDLSGVEILFADNGSTDNSFEDARRSFEGCGINWIDNGANLGYAAGNNAAATQASGRFLLFLNNDTEVGPHAVASLKKHLEAQPDIAGGQCALIQDANRMRLEAAGVDVDIFGFCYARESGALPESQSLPKKIFTGVGAALVISAEVFHRLGGFDESFFLLYEETDLCWRIALSGESLLYFPDVHVYHVGGGTRVKGPKQVRLFVRNRVRTLRKNLGPVLLPLALSGNIAAMTALALTYLVRRRADMATATVQGLREAMFDPNVSCRRRETQSMRKVSDSELLRRGLLRLPSIAQLMKNARAYA